MSNYLKSKADAMKVFRDNCNNYPLWRIFELGKKSPIYTNMIEGDESKTIKMFDTALVDLYPDKIYTVQMYRNLSHRKGGQKFIIPNHEFSFQFGREEVVIPPVNGIPVANPNPSPAYVPPIPPYGIDMRQQIGLSDHVAMITAKAKAESDCEYLKNIVSDQAKTISELERENGELRKENEELNEEMDEMEKEVEENEKEAAIKGTESTSLEGAIASVIKENGGVVLENLFNKGVKGSPEFTTDEISGKEEEEEEQQEPKINGIATSVFLMELGMIELNNKMLAMNHKWKEHLCKLILIGEQKPATFKMFMKKLEEF